MPYIKQDRRACVDRYVVAVGERGAYQASDSPKDCGELNYALTMACLWHKKIKFGELDSLMKNIVRNYLADEPLRYQRINDAIGAITCAAFELERRTPRFSGIHSAIHLIATLVAECRDAYYEIGVPYETKKIAENGDIAEYGSPAQ